MGSKKKKLIPTIKPNADRARFRKTDGITHRRGTPAQPARQGRDRIPPSTPPSTPSSERVHSSESKRGSVSVLVSDNIPRERQTLRDSKNSREPLQSCSVSYPSHLDPILEASQSSGNRRPYEKEDALGIKKSNTRTTRGELGRIDDRNVSSSFFNSTRETAKVSSLIALKMQYDAALLVTECQLHPATFAALAISNGGVIIISLEGLPPLKAYLQAFISTSLARGCIRVSEDLSLSFHIPLNTSVLASSACKNKDLSIPLSWPLITRICVELCSMHNDSNEDTTQSGSSASSPIPWRALFRKNFHNRLVSKAMRASLRHFFHTVYVEVREIVAMVGEGDEGCEEELPFGILTSATRIEVVSSRANSLADFNPSESDGTSLSTHCGFATLPLFSPDRHVLIVGESGTGKTYTVNALARVDRNCYHRRVIFVSPEELAQGSSSEICTAIALREKFRMARLSSPATVVIDDLDILCGVDSEASSTSFSESSSASSEWARKLFTRVLSVELEQSQGRGGCRGSSIHVLATAKRLNGLSASLLTPSQFAPENVITLHSPVDAEERYNVLLSCIHQRLLDKQGTMEVKTVRLEGALREVAQNAHGFNQRDLSSLVDFAMMESFKRQGTTLMDADDLYKAAKAVHPSALSGVELSIPQVTWADIGGSEEAKKTLQDVVQWCLGKQSWMFQQFNLTPPKGVLLYGPPGCSKTMLAKALANESHMNFISVKGPEVFSKWVGDSEKAVRDIFARARAVAPCVVFVDELDGMCGHRGQGGVSDRVISQFLTELDGLPSSFSEKKQALVFVAATNRPDSIDAAVLRPGRIDRRVHVGLPNSAEREAIVRIQFKTLPVSPDLDPAYLAQRTEGYTGAEIVAVVNEAAFTAISRDLNAEYLSTDDVDAALEKVKPRVDPKDAAWYKSWPHNPSLTLF